MLVVIGKKGIQTDWKLDGEALEEASQGKDNVSFYYPENANHVLKHDPRPREEITAATWMFAYDAPETFLAAEALKTILEWLSEQSEQVRAILTRPVLALV